MTNDSHGTQSTLGRIAARSFKEADAEDIVEEFLQQWRDVENVTAEKILMLK